MTGGWNLRCAGLDRGGGQGFSLSGSASVGSALSSCPLAEFGVIFLVSECFR
ncbi:hypothetical protein A2U01_0073269, partial [Trifolium medium]|nr:hypothetical protein [Trifolium medium]